MRTGSMLVMPSPRPQQILPPILPPILLQILLQTMIPGSLHFWTMMTESLHFWTTMTLGITNTPHEQLRRQRMNSNIRAMLGISHGTLSDLPPPPMYLQFVPLSRTHCLFLRGCYGLSALLGINVYLIPYLFTLPPPLKRIQNCLLLTSLLLSLFSLSRLLRTSLPLPNPPPKPRNAIPATVPKCSCHENPGPLSNFPFSTLVPHPSLPLAMRVGGSGVLVPRHSHETKGWWMEGSWDRQEGSIQ